MLSLQSILILSLTPYLLGTLCVLGPCQGWVAASGWIREEHLRHSVMHAVLGVCGAPPRFLAL